MTIFTQIDFLIVRIKSLLFCLAICFVFYACSRNYHYEGLRKLSHDELYERALDFNIDPDGVMYKNEKNEIIYPTELSRYNRDSFTMDKYVDKSDTVRLYLIRPIRNEDIDLREKIQNLYNNDVEYRIKYVNLTVKDSLLRKNILSVIHLDHRPIKPIKINCDSAKIILKTILFSDQNNRTGQLIDGQVDRNNQIQVVSMLEQCEFPENFIGDNEAIYTIFLVIQHASAELRLKYFPLLQKVAELGGLEKKVLALMEDRILMEQGEKQKFGSQVRMIDGSEKYEIYPIEDPVHLDDRRAKIGLEPMQEYLSRFNINWGEYLKKQNKD